MDDDWDLHAVVRGCAAPSAAANSDHSPITSPPVLDDHNENPDLILDNHMFNPFEGLHEIYREFCAPPASTAANTVPFPAPPQTNMQRQEILQLENPIFGSSPCGFSASSQSNRPRRRKTQEMKIVREMREEELSADSWAWRKYGQKPIKGSQYPRNYYRCSTSKGCGARKQVERSPNDPTIFVVSYTGEHTHPRPTHRNSLAGSSRNKLSPAAADISKTPLIPKGTSSCSFSPCDQSVLEEEAAAQNGNDADTVSAPEDGGYSMSYDSN